jgi:hypothetical protein
MINHISLAAVALAVLHLIPSPDSTHIPKGHAVKADGHVGATEWEDAETTSIAVEPGWTVRVRLKHDEENLYFLFENVKHDDQRLFPEIFIDPEDRRSEKWERSQWWLHVSYNLCEGHGEPNVYRKNGVFLCAHQKEGWTANNPPRRNTQSVEVTVSFAKLGIRPTPGLRIGLALAVTDATGDEAQTWFFAPPTATVGSPKSWGEAVLD